MKEGLLWYDGDPGRDLSEKIERAARRYRQKYGAPPNICYVHPSVVNGVAPAKKGEPQAHIVRKVGGVQVASLPSVLRHHFWLGREETQCEARP
jgi:hypothetical protein